jgi:hypothetical protein
LANATAWLKAHWKPLLAVSVAAAAVLYFLFSRKKGSGATTLTLPAASLGGGSTGPGNVADSGVAAATAPLIPAVTVATAPLGSLWDQWLAALAPASILSGGRSFQAWAGDLVARYHSETGQLPAGVTQGAGFYTYTPAFLQSLYPQYRTASGPPTASQAAGPVPPRVIHPPLPVRGSGFRGGDVYPSFTGQTAALAAARQASASGLPAAPLGTPMRAKQPTKMDVRRSERRYTDIAEISRGSQAVPLPQSFSVVIRQTNPEHQNSIFKRPGRFL